MSLYQDGFWSCPLCHENPLKFGHKCQLLSHWFENHSNKEITYESCQWCMELFTSPKHSEQVKDFDSPKNFSHSYYFTSYEYDHVLSKSFLSVHSYLSE